MILRVNHTQQRNTNCISNNEPDALITQQCTTYISDREPNTLAMMGQYYPIRKVFLYIDIYI